MVKTATVISFQHRQYTEDVSGMVYKSFGYRNKHHQLLFYSRLRRFTNAVNLIENGFQMKQKLTYFPNIYARRQFSFLASADLLAWLATKHGDAIGSLFNKLLLCILILLHNLWCVWI